MDSTKRHRGPRLNAEGLRQAAKEMRAIAITDIYAAGSGHPGGSLSIMDIAAALYLNVLNHDPDMPTWPERDRVFWSAGHKAPALYVALGRAGYFPLEDTVSLRQLGSKFEGHPNRLKLPGVEISSGSLGQGLSIAVGSALAAKRRQDPYRVYCIMGDGEHQEGSVWEAVMAAAHYNLDNLCAIVDRNRLQIDGWVQDVMNVEPLGLKYATFGWNVIEIDGHDMGEILGAFDAAAAHRGNPTMILANTIKGKGVSFMENQASWHGAAPNREQFDKAMAELATPAVPQERIERMLSRAKEGAEDAALTARNHVPMAGRNYWWNARDTMKVEMDSTRMGFGRGLETAGADERVCTIQADISGSIRISDFAAKHPERQGRVFSVGIAEQNMMGVAAGLAKEGFIPVTGTYGVFASGRAWDQLRTTVCYNNLNVKIAGAHGGISVGPDGATHQSLEEISLMTVLPNMHMVAPCDSVETEKATRHCLLEVDGPVYLRFAREATPLVTTPDTPYRFGVANVIRYRAPQPRFIDAFETFVSTEYSNENEDATIVACGPMVPEAMRAAWLLKEEFGIETRVINMHTIKPLDTMSLLAAATETQIVITAEEHQKGGFGNLIAGAILRERSDFAQPLLLDMIGVEDRFGFSGKPWELIQTFGLTAEHIAQRVLDLYAKKMGFNYSKIKEGATMTMLECSACHTQVPLEKYLHEPLVPEDESCVECESKSPDGCATCRLWWMNANPEFTFLCRECREVAMPS
ncbi:MAG TPA: transketolase [Candidatus Acidoferrales bacterium]|nr:transketolase [Candidatus Acidoferrales bacterium]